MPVFMTVQDVAKMLHRCPSRVYNWIYENKFPNARKVIDGWLIPESDVLTMLNSYPKPSELPPDPRGRGQKPGYQIKRKR